MTTREEMALGFAREAYGKLLSGLQTGTEFTENALDNIAHEAVEMADLLLVELSKGQPPIKPQVNLKDREACG